MQKRKIDLLKVEIVDFGMNDGKYREDYRGMVVTNGLSYQYFQLDGKASWCIGKELTNCIIAGDIATDDGSECGIAYESAPNDRGTIIDAIGAKPKSITIEF